MPFKEKFPIELQKDFVCFECKTIVIGDYSKLTKHFRRIHSFQTSNRIKKNIVCNQNGCRMEFDSFGNYRLHLKLCENKYSQQVTRRHSNETQGNELTGTLVQLDSHEDLEDGNLLNDTTLPLNDGNIPSGEENSFCITREVAKLMLKLKADKNVTHSALNLLAKGLENIIRREYLSRNETPPRSCESLHQLNSQAKRTKYFKDNFGLLEPEEIFLGHRKVWKRSKSGKFYWKLIPRTFQYISLEKTFTALCKQVKFRNLVSNEKESIDGYMHKDRDAKGFKKRSQLRNQPFAFRIQLWGDEVEYANPLGSKNNKNGNIMSLAFTLPNLPPAQNALLSNIHTVAVIKSSDLKTYGFDPVFRKLMEEIKKLESEHGLTIHVQGHPLRLHGTIASVCGDTKGAHEMFGLMSPSADKFCRLCLISRKDILNHPTAETVIMRSRTQHDAEVIKANEHGRQIDSGVNSHCVLNESKYFHVAENLIMDGMHDVFEGVDPFLLMLCLRHWITTQNIDITAAVLNNRILRFDFGPYDEKNKPSANFTEANIRQQGNYSTRQRASQNWCLLRSIPLLIGDLVEEGDVYFGMLLTLLDIMDIVFNPKVSIEDTVNLSLLIQELFKQFQQNFPGVNPINKLHHLIHYPEIIRTNGPAMGYWCMRYEGLHNSFKRISQINSNFSNTPKSVSNHLMLLSCSALLDEHCFVENPITFGPFQWTDNEEAEVVDGEFNLFSENEQLKVPSWIKVGGWIYFKNTIILLKKSQDCESGLPVFGRITQLFMRNDSDPYAMITTLKTIKYDKHFHSYQVEENILENVNKFISLKSLTEAPLWLSNNFGDECNQFVNPRHLL